jgi:hypothetical protein
VSADLPPELAAKRDELLWNATSRGMRMRIWRRVAIAATVVGAVSAVVGTSVALVGGDHAARVVTSAPDSTLDTSSSIDPTTTIPDVGSTVATSSTTDGSVPTGVTDTTPAPGSSGPTTDTTALVCHNSYDPRCGPLTFTSTPVNQPLRLTIEKTLTGTLVALRIVAADDAAVDPCMHISWGDGESSVGPGRFGCAAEGLCVRFPERFGPWDPPPPVPESVTLEFTHEYTSAGTYNVTIDADSAVPCSPDQFYSSQATDTLVVKIAAPTTTTT